MTEALPLERRRELHRRALWLEYFTVGWNVIEGVVAIGAGIIAGGAERRALYVVAATFFLLAAYIAYEAGTSLLGREAPDRSTVGLILSVLSLVIMPVLAWSKQRTGREMGSRALVADAAETWVCSYLSLALLAGVGLHGLFGWWWADPVGALAMLPVILWQGWETLGEARERDDEEDLGVAGHGP